MKALVGNISAGLTFNKRDWAVIACLFADYTVFFTAENRNFKERLIYFVAFEKR